MKTGMKLTNSLGRQINYLPLSITDHCNIRCFYCMPKEGTIKTGHNAILSYEELLLIAETAVELAGFPLPTNSWSKSIKASLPALHGIYASLAHAAASASSEMLMPANGTGRLVCLLKRAST